MIKDAIMKTWQSEQKQYQIKETWKKFMILQDNYQESHHNRKKPIKDKNGNTLNTMEEQRQRWSEHFWGLLNSPATETMTEIRPAANHLAIDCSNSSINDFIIRPLRCWKTENLQVRLDTCGGIKSRPTNNS